VGRVDLDAVVEAQEHARQALVRLRGRARAAEVGAPNRPDEERVPGEDEPRLRAALEVGDEETDRVRRMARGVGDRQPDPPDVERVAVAQPLVVEGEPGRRVGEDRRARRGGEVTVARDVIGVRVRLDDVRDREAAAPGQSQIFVDAVAPGIDDDGPPGLAAADQVREAPGLFVDDLLEDHPGSLFYARTSVLLGLLLFGLRLLDDLVRQERRDLLVVGELHRVGAAPAGHRAQA